MLRKRTGKRLDTWLAQVEHSHLPELQSFAAGIEKDKDAVKAGLTWWINNGRVEGHVTKLKLIKRQGYGRAGFPSGCQTKTEDQVSVLWVGLPCLLLSVHGFTTEVG